MSAVPSPSEALARRLGVPRLEHHRSLSSTMDRAHTLGAEGAPDGTFVLADAQTAGRGRGGRPWASAPGAGIWGTLLVRPSDPAAISVLSLRTGLAAAAALEPMAPGPVRLKWPNDLFVGAGKLGGILVEARWRESRPEWVAIGIGINLRLPPEGTPGLAAAALAPGATVSGVLERLVPAMRGASARRGLLDAGELAAWGERDLAVHRRSLEPTTGTVLGITAEGALRVATPSGEVTCRGGSLVLAAES